VRYRGTEAHCWRFEVHNMKVVVYNQQGEKAGQAELPKEIFEVPLNSDLVHQVATAQMANRRQGTAHTKGRGEISGGGRKPWRQKHTGRARHGSIRSPIWRGGGVTFGPTSERNYTKKLNAKMRRKALLMVLSEKARKDLLVLLEDFKMEKPRTKTLVELLSKLPSKSRSSLIALPQMDKKVILSARNIARVSTIQAKDLNTLDLLNKQYIVLPKDSISVIQDTFGEKKVVETKKQGKKKKVQSKIQKDKK